MYIIGISAYYHDSAACLIKNGKIIAAAQEERFTRKKHDSNFPHHSIIYCVKEAQILTSEIDFIVFYEKPFLKFERILETFLAFAPKGFRSFLTAIPVWVKDKLFQKQLILKQLSNTLGKDIKWKERLLFSEHHLSHAASAFYPSPFKNAAILTLDGVGEWTTTSIAIGNNKEIKIVKEIFFPHSIGLLYSAFTYYLGFRINSGEYKVMGLAPYGKPIYANLIKEKLIRLKNDGSFQLDMSYFNFTTGLTMTNKKFDFLLGGPARNPESKLTEREMNLASSIQKVIEEIIVKIAKNIALETKEKNLCLAGGVALNCVANGILLQKKIFENIWIQPAAGDAGCAIGAALSAWHIHFNKDRKLNKNRDQMSGSFLGPEFSNNDIKKTLNICKANYHILSDKALFTKVSEGLSNGKAIGWMQGRMEFGPRALGNRSIIADPRSKFMQNQLNIKIKFRESFRPFAPSILIEHLSEWFELDKESPYMLFVDQVQMNKRIKIKEKEKLLDGFKKLNISRSIIPAVTHIDYSSRIQTVHRDTNKKFYDLIHKFYEMTDCPLVVNTSFNIRGEPIVCNPYDAFKCFMGTDLDMLAVGNYLLYKEEQSSKIVNYQNDFDLD